MKWGREQGIWEFCDLGRDDRPSWFPTPEMINIRSRRRNRAQTRSLRC